MPRTATHSRSAGEARRPLSLRLPGAASLAIVGALLAAPVGAQRSSADARPAAGARVRVSVPPSRRVVGTVLAYRGDTLLLRRPTWNGAETTSVGLGAVRRLEVSVGKRRRLLKGAALGLTG